MEDEQSKATGHEFKIHSAYSMVEFMIAKYFEDLRPRVILWREFMKAYSKDRDLPNPISKESKRGVNRHLKRYLSCIVKELMRRRFDVIPIAQPPDNLLKHGQRPDVTKELSESYYKKCIPAGGSDGTSRPTMGFIIFPKGSDPHPVALIYRKIRMMQSASQVDSSAKRTDHSGETGTISEVHNEEIKATAEQKCIEAFHPHPLFEIEQTPRKAIGLNLPKYPPESGA